MAEKYLAHIEKAQRATQFGGKAANLAYLKKKNFKIPNTYVCSFSAYQQFRSGNNVEQNLEKEIRETIDERKKYAIRSSANIEDAKEHTFAGQFETYLNVQGLSAVMDAITKIWQSTRSDKVRTYLDKIGTPSQELQMAVIIQEMVDSKLSGVVFTKNPLNGMDEIVIESVTGLGEDLVKRGITPERWIYKWGSWTQKPQHSDNNIHIMEEIALQAKQIADTYRKAANLEWACDGEAIYWLQLREITSLKGINAYTNRVSKEFLPGIIKPLIWSINIPVVNSSWKRLFVELIGTAARDINIDNLAKAFYYRAYFNMGIVGDIFELLGMPRESVELVMGLEFPGSNKPKFQPSVKTFKYLPRMIFFALNKSRFSRETSKFLVRQKKKYDFFASLNLEPLNEKETLNYIDELINANKESSYFVIITQLLSGFYNMMLKRTLKRSGNKIEEFDLTDTELRDIDPNFYLSILHERYNQLPATTQTALQQMNCQKSSPPDAQDFTKEFEEFLVKFGHLSDSGNDFSKVPWREMPEFVFKMIVDFDRSEVVPSDKFDVKDLKISPIKGIFLNYMYDHAVMHRQYKERTSFLYTYGYGLFRPYFLHLGTLLWKNGFIQSAQDIFYLTFDEINDILTRSTTYQDDKIKIENRKQEITKYHDVLLPDIIYGDLPPLLLDTAVKRKLTGIPASKGYYEGPVVVARGIEDFKTIKEGVVLVIPYSDVGWSPLFAKAKAIISESGGILSHAAIVAREYAIPAVVSVQGALELTNNTIVGVDGNKGEVLVKQ